MILSDVEIREYLKKGLLLKNYKEENITSCSVDLTLSNEIAIYEDIGIPYIDVKNSPKIKTLKIENEFYLQPKSFVLATTEEYITLPDNIAGIVDGKSSLARRGLLVHVSSSLVDPGFEGNLVLEMFNVNNVPIKIYKGMKIAKIFFIKLSSPTSIPYNKREDAKFKHQKEIKL
ncbi:MAG: dCTP deaminase [Candidatus Aenigmatarchaeota archaeon]